MGSSSGFLCSWISANQILCWSSLNLVPFFCFFSFASLPLLFSTLSAAASSQLGHSESWLGGGWSLSHASRRAVLVVSSVNRAMSKNVDAFGGAVGRPQIVKTGGE